MNFVKRSLEGGRIRSEVGVSLLPASDLPNALANLSCSPEMSAGELTQRLHRMVQDPRAIVKDGDLNVILPNGLADLLGIELLKL